MTSLLISSPLISILHRLFGCRDSNPRDVVASSPSFSCPAARVPLRACSQTISYINLNVQLKKKPHPVVQEKTIFLLGKYFLKLACTMSKGPGKSSSNKIFNQDQQELASGKQNMRAACQKDKLEIKFFFSSPVKTSEVTLTLSLVKLFLYFNARHKQSFMLHADPCNLNGYLHDPFYKHKPQCVQ